MESCKTEIEKILYQSFPILARHPILSIPRLMFVGKHWTEKLKFIARITTFYLNFFFDAVTFKQ